MNERPTSGARYVVERDDAAGEEGVVVYRGFVHLPDADLPLVLRVDRERGAVRAAIDRSGVPEGLPDGLAADHERVAAALVRSATKAAIAAGTPLPRRIARWR